MVLTDQRGDASGGPARGELATQPRFLLDPLLRPRSLAIVGASENGRWSRVIFDHLREGGFPGRIQLINPKLRQLWDQPCFPDFASLPVAVDHAVVLVGADAVSKVLIEGGRAGLRSALVFASGIGDGEDPRSSARAAAVRSAIENFGVRVCGPNTLGTVSVHERAILFPDIALRKLRPGGVGAVFQSGGVLQFWLKTMSERGADFSYAVGSGNEIDCDLSDYLDFMIDDPHTRVLAVFIEGIRRPEAFRSSCARALEAGKPIVAIKIGRSSRGKAQTLSHTGALAGDDDVFDAFCRRWGVTRCRSLDEMVEVTLAFQGGRLPRGERMAFVVHSGGMKGLILDEAEEQDVQCAALEPATIDSLKSRLTPDVKIENPLDASISGALDPKNHAEICVAIARDPQVDIVALNAVLPRAGSRGHSQTYRSILESTDKPVIGVARMRYDLAEGALEFQREAGFPFLQGIPESVRAMRALVDYNKRRRRSPPTTHSIRGNAADLLPFALANTTARFGIPSPRGGFAADGASAARLAASIGYPVALKLRSRDIMHKTEVGAVRIGLKSAEEVIQAADEMVINIRTRLEDILLDGFLVQEMVDGVELVVGTRADFSFGPYLLVGVGGVFVELINRTRLICLPLDLEELDAALASPPLAPLLRGFRGRKPADIGALRRALVGVADLYLAHRDLLADFEINPLIVKEDGQGVIAVDIRAIPCARS